jgi:hypothetical protein
MCVFEENFVLVAFGFSFIVFLLSYSLVGMTQQELEDDIDGEFYKNRKLKEKEDENDDRV